MKLQVFTVRDSAAEMFANPQFLTARGQAIRAFSDEVNRSAADNNLYLHPDDFDLYALGEYDTDSAVFTLYSSPERIARGKDVKLNGKV